MTNRKMRITACILALLLMLSPATAFALDRDYAVMVTGTGVETEVQLTIADLMDLPAEAQINDAYLYNSRGGEKTVQVKGVSLAYVLTELAGVTAAEGEVLMTASDGYPIAPQTLADVMDEALQYVLAYEIDGEPIDDDDNPATEDITVYRKVKEAGEFGTVFKLVERIEVMAEAGEAPEAEEVPEEEATEEPDVVEGVELTFTDITAAYAFAEEAIADMVNRDVISGVGNNLFAPGDSLTRAQIATIMVKSLSIEPAPYQGGFADVATGDWFAPYVQAAADADLFSGYPDGTFKPNQVINRQEIAVVAGKAAVETGKVEQERMAKFVMEKSDYVDKDAVASWAGNQVAWLEAQGVFEGVAGANFEPVKVVNRAEAVVVIFNTLFK
mgnify:CR=1 FL=1